MLEKIVSTSLPWTLEMRIRGRGGYGGETLPSSLYFDLCSFLCKQHTLFTILTTS